MLRRPRLLHLISSALALCLLILNVLGLSAAIPREHYHGKIDNEDDTSNDTVRYVGSCVAAQLPAQASIDDTEDDHASAEPSVHDAEDGSSAGLVVVEMLVETHCWLEEDKHGYYDEADDLVVAVYFTNTVAQDDTESQADDEEDCGKDLKGCMNESDFLRGGQIQGEREEWKQRQEEHRHNDAVRVEQC